MFIFHIPPLKAVLRSQFLDFASAVDGVLLRKEKKNGRLIRPVTISDIGCAMVTPCICKRAFMINSTGLRTAPERIIAITEASVAFLML